MGDLSQRIAALSPAQRQMLERRLKGGARPGAGNDIVPHKADQTIFPLSSCQERLWFEHHLHAGSPIYTEAIVLDISGPLKPATLERSYSELVRRHKILRTCFKQVDGQLRQIVSEPFEVVIPILDLSQTSAEEAELEAKRAGSTEARRSFELEGLPLFRCLLIKLSDQRSRLIFSGHHITIDGWSIGLFFEELFQTYAALASARNATLPKPQIQYVDYAQWQQGWLASQSARKQLDFWKAKLARLGEDLRLPTDHPRQPVRDAAGAREPFSLGAELSAALRALSQRQSATLFMLLLAGFKTLLHRYTGQAQLTVGSPNTNRSRRELEEVIGPFINMFVLSTEVSGDQTFVELLAKVQATTLEAYENRDFPFEKLVAELQLERDLSRTPLFQVMFDLQRLPTPADPPGLKVRFLESDSGIAKFDLSLLLRETDTDISASWEYSTQLFERGTIQRMQCHYLTLLESVARDPNIRVSDASILTAEERLQLLTWNSTKVEWPDNLPVTVLFESTVERFADRVAAVSSNSVLTYEGLDRQASRLANRLKRSGVGPETVVGLCLERGFDMLVSQLGILKSGGCYLPLDPDYPAERLRFMLEDSGATLVVTQSSLQDIFSAWSVTTLNLDEDRTADDTDETEIQTSSIDVANLAYVIYTSGSTGKPKGVEITHRALTNFLLFMRQRIGICPDDTVLGLTSLSFDIAVLELLLPLISGAKVAIADRESALDPARLAAAIDTEQVTLMQATPTTWSHLAQSGWAGRQGLKILCGGEALSGDLAERLLAFGSSVCNLYGPTETTVWSTIWDVTSCREILIGSPIANTQTHVVDPRINEMPVGVPGDLYIAGLGLARAYTNRPDLTAERFIPNAFELVPGQRVYKTGDLARYKADGRLEFLGRNDHQVKVRGFRIEPQEIESVLSTHPSVSRCAIIGKESGNGSQRLVAFVSSLNGEVAGDFRSYLKQRLPDYMVPSALVLTESLPMTSNGKIDRKALAHAEIPLSEEKREAASLPQNTTERKMAGIWTRLLGLTEIAIDENFFYLGGYSLLAATLASDIRKTFGIDMPLAKIFETPTIEGLSHWIDHQLGQDPAAAPLVPRCIVPIQTSGDKSPIFFVPPGSGSPNCYRNIAARLGSDQPVYGFLSPGLLEGDTTPASIAGMARIYIDAMTKLQPAGPYIIAGWSFGAFVAFEIAQQIEARGDTVALLALIDAAPPGNPGKSLWRAPRFVARFGASIFKTLFGPRLPRSYQEVRRLANWTGIDLPESFGSIWRRDKQSRTAFLRILASSLLRSIKVFRATLIAFLKYVPEEYGGRVLLFGAKEEPGKVLSLESGLTRLVRGGVVRIDVPGNHMTILDEAHAGSIAEKLRESVDGAGPSVALFNKRKKAFN